MMRLVLLIVACVVVVNAAPFGVKIAANVLPAAAKTRNEQLNSLMKTKSGKALTVASEYLKVVLPSIKGQAELSFNIDGKSFTCKRKEIVTTKDGFTWVGTQKGDGNGGGCTFTVCGCSLNGNAALIMKNFAARWLFRTVSCTDPKKESIVRVAQVQPEAAHELQARDDVGTISADTKKRLAAAANSADSTAPKTFKLLVAYTKDTGKAANPTASKVDATMRASINDAAARMNLAFSSSGRADVKAVVSEIYASTSAYTSTSTADYMTELKKLGTGKFPDVYTRIKAVKPDITVLIVPPTVTNACGQATILPATAKDAFATVQLTCLEAVANSMAHEIGHNFGCLHNVEQYGGVAQPGNAHGYLSKKAANHWRTLLAYPATNKETRILRYSNPTIKYPLTGTDSEPTGDTNAKCADQIGKRISTIITFRNQW